MNKSGLIKQAKYFFIYTAKVFIFVFAFHFVVHAETESLPKPQATKKLSAFAALLPHNNTNECKLRGYRPPFNKPPYNRHKYNKCLKMIETLTRQD
ncbi:MAG: hypothetical protein GKR93_12480 [Gammaproteobacteria bacterium]|nr:hypothetical protein [Gammaproteobacteria bacterium]